MITNQLSFRTIGYSTKIDYVHNNPVEEGLVYTEDYVYSSAIVDYSGQKD
jgi:hypothetical protein